MGESNFPTASPPEAEPKNTARSVLDQEQITIGAGGHQPTREPAKPGAPAASTTGRDAGRLGSLTAKTQQLPPPLELGTKVTM